MAPANRARSRRHAALGITLALAFSAGCTGKDASNLPDYRVWESEHFRYHTRADEPLACMEVVDELERHLELIQAHLGFSWPNPGKVDYYKFRDVQDYKENSGCPSGSGSCTRDGKVLSPYLLQHHELVHAYLAPLGLPPALFVEGIAVVLACRSGGVSIQPRSWREVVALPFDDDRVFLEGPWFVGYLLDEFGPTQFLEFYASISYQAQADEIAAAFEAVYDQTLEQAWAAAESAGTSFRCRFVWECDGPSLDLDGTKQGIAQSCDASDAFRTFTIEQEQAVVIHSDSVPVQSPQHCQIVPARLGGSETHWFATLALAEPGKYFVAPYDVTTRIGIEPLTQSTLAATCTDAATLDLSDPVFAGSHLEVVLPQGAGERFVRLEPSDGGEVCFDGVQRGMLVEECANCTEPCEPAGCPITPDTRGTVTLRLTPGGGGQWPASAELVLGH